MYETLQTPPLRGSLQEWTLLLFVNRLEEIEYARFHALAQLLADKDKGVEAFERYMKIAFPGFESRKRAQDEGTKKQLSDWVKTGPLKVVPLSSPTGRSRFKTRTAKVVNDPKQDQLYSRLTDRMGKGHAGS